MLKKKKEKDKKQENLWEPEAAIEKRRRHLLDIGDIRYFLKRIVFIGLCLFVFFGLIFGVKPVNNDDMKPRFGAGDVLFYYRWDRNFVSQDVVVYEAEGKTRIGRVVARPGDEVVVDEGGLSVNGYRSYEGEIFYSTKPYEEGVTFPISLASNEYFLLADYREGGKDSRYFGAIPDIDIRGKVIAVVRWVNI